MLIPMNLVAAALLALLQDPVGREYEVESRLGVWHVSGSPRFAIDDEPTEGTNIDFHDSAWLPTLSVRFTRKSKSDPPPRSGEYLEITYLFGLWEDNLNTPEIFDGLVIPPGSGSHAEMRIHYLGAEAMSQSGNPGDPFAFRGGVHIPILWTTLEVESESHGSRTGGVGLIGGLEVFLPDTPFRAGAFITADALLGWRDFGWLLELRFFVGVEWDRFSFELGDRYWRYSLENYPSRDDERIGIELHGLYLAFGVKF